MNQFANTKDLLAGYAVGNINGKLKEMVYADHILFCEEEVLREVITHSPKRHKQIMKELSLGSKKLITRI